MSSIRLNRIDAMIAELKSLERVDDESERLKVMAIRYLETYADRLDAKGVKAIKKCPGAATPDGHTENLTT